MNSSFFSTGNKDVDQMISVRISGNVVPVIWFKRIVRKKTGKPYHLAIHILADIVYWFRPIEIRSEETGFLEGYKKKFQGDYLRKSYAAYALMFGESNTARVKEAVHYLADDIGVIRINLETKPTVKGNREYTGYIHITLNVSVLKEITFESSETNAGNNPYSKNSATPFQKQNPLAPLTSIPPDDIGSTAVQKQCNNDISNGNNIYKSSIYHSLYDGHDEIDEDKVIEILDNEGRIIYDLLSNDFYVRESVKLLIEFSSLPEICMDEEEKAILSLFTEALTELLTKKETMISDEVITNKMVCDRVNDRLKIRGYGSRKMIHLNETIFQDAFDNFKRRAEQIEIKKPLQYMKACTWTALNTAGINVYTKYMHRGFGTGE